MVYGVFSTTSRNNAKYGPLRRSRSFKVTDFGTIRKLICGFLYWLTLTYLLSCTVSKLWPIIGQISLATGALHFNALAGGGPLRIHGQTLPPQKLEWLSRLMLKNAGLYIHSSEQNTGRWWTDSSWILQRSALLGRRAAQLSVNLQHMFPAVCVICFVTFKKTASVIGSDNILQRVRIARNADRCNSQNDSVGLSVRLSVRSSRSGVLFRSRVLQHQPGISF